MKTYETDEFNWITKDLNGKSMKKGICDKDMSEIMFCVAEKVKLFNFVDMLITRDISCYSQMEAWFTPKNWICEINHFYFAVRCVSDEKTDICIIDIPMKEYTTRDNKLWYYNHKDTFNIYLIQSLKDIMEAWECSREDAMKVVKDVQECKLEEDFTTFFGTVNELWEKITH